MTTHMDILGPLEPEETAKPNKPRYLLTIIDSHSRWLEAVPMYNIDSDTVCNALLLNWVARFGPPLQLTADRGTQFTAKSLRSLLIFWKFITYAQQRTILEQTD